jgi:sterol desaturase/sphingolipid hydroxylase (fatty acid hydroxylase superfamily)
MAHTMTSDPSLLRLAIFLAVFGLMLLWEWRRPFRVLPEGKLRRIVRHVGMMCVNTVCLHLLSGGGAYLAASVALERHWGLLTLANLPPYLAMALGLLLLDLAIYFQHRLFHRLPLLWRLHRIHHLDPGFDTTTAIRFHPLEIVLSMYYKIAVTVVLGVSPLTILVFESLLNACALFNHGNVRLPAGLTRALGPVLITPDFHRIHHSARPAETHSNFGFCVPWWDRLLGTFTPKAAEDQADMVIGLAEERDPARLGLDRLLMLPFRQP